VAKTSGTRARTTLIMVIQTVEGRGACRGGGPGPDPVADHAAAQHNWTSMGLPSDCGITLNV
jgi:hypothetical protein